MNSRSAVLIGQQAPRVACEPAAEWSHADDAAFLASSYGLTPDEWQFAVLEAWLGVRRNGRWAATSCGLAVPRQNGKNGVLEIRELYGIVALGEKFLHTAHEVKTARKAFLRLKSFFENERQFPELAELAVEIRKTNGQEAIVLANGGSVEFVARSKGSGRGFTVDVLVLDEAQELSDEALDALKPTISAAPSQNPQTIFTGTPPSATMNGEVFSRTRQAALTGSATRLAWHEWSVERSPDLNLDDKTLWAATNPALGTRLNLEVLEDERASFSDEGFARERLGMWEDTDRLGAAIPLELWTATEREDAAAVEVHAFAVAVDPDRVWSAIGMAGPHCSCSPPQAQCTPGLVHVESVNHARGSGWVVDRCVALDQRHGPAQFVVDEGGPAGSLITELESRGLSVVRVKLSDVKHSYGLFMDALAQGTLRHGPQASLLEAVKSAKTRSVGDGALAFGRKPSGADITELEAVSLAHWAAVTVPKVNILNSIW